MKRRIDIIVVNWHGHAEVAAAVSRLRPWQHGRVHVVDNSRSATEWTALQSALPPGQDLNLIAAPQNLGFAGGCNLAWQAEAVRAADHVLLLNPDARIEEQAVRGLSDVLDADPHAATVCPRIDWDEAGGFTLPAPPQQGLAAPWREALHSRLRNIWPQLLMRLGTSAVLQTRTLTQAARPWCAQTASGGVLMIRRAAVEGLPARHRAPGGALFDPRYFMYFEDTDLATRLTASGWRLLMSPRQRAVHGWRHQPHKAPLMAQAQAVYLQQHHALGMKASAGALRWLAGSNASAGTEADPWLWLPLASPAPLEDLASARLALGAVWALSPSPHLQPALARCGERAEPLNAAEWSLVEPGRHAALVATLTPSGTDNLSLAPQHARWVRFDKR